MAGASRPHFAGVGTLSDHATADVTRDGVAADALLACILASLDDDKAEEIVSIDLRGKSTIAEFVQDAASPDALAGAVRELLQNPERRIAQQAKLRQLAVTLGSPGAARRAAAAILSTLTSGR